MAGHRKKLGALGEKLAVQFLKERGYLVRETNYRCREGEIDIVAQQGEEVVFVEVRTRQSQVFGTPEESVTEAKKEKLVASALNYLASHPHLPPSWRVDVVAIEIGRDGKPSRLELIENAIS